MEATNYEEQLKVIKLKKQEFIKEQAKLIRDYVKSQLKLWQKIPYLAVQAQGRERQKGFGGFSDNYNLAYEHGLWRLGAGNLFVDCENAELVFDQPENIINDETVVGIDLSNFNAKYITDSLFEESKLKSSEAKCFTPFGRSAPIYETPEAWREEMERKYDRHPSSYVRKIVLA